LIGALNSMAQHTYTGNYNTRVFRKHPYKGVIELIGGIGVTYYMGDLRKSTLKNFELGPNIAIGLTYRFTERLSARGEFRIYNVGGKQESANNLSFRTTNPDAYLGLQLDLFKYTAQKPFNMYLFGGVGATYLTPRGELDGKWYSLPDYQTEGIKYNRLVIIAPAGIGFTYRYNHALNLGMEVSGMYVNSDYFDDVSTVYTSFDDKASIAARLADKNTIAPNLPGFVRGNAKNKDVYVILSLRATHTLGSSKKAVMRSRTKCVTK
jgi:hypothetical protein